MKVGTDSDLLGALCAGGSRILDIGTGTGVLSLMLAQRCPEARITAIEIDKDAVTDARRNFALSPWSERISLEHTSLQDFLEGYHGPRFDSIVCNPPYFDRSLECPNPGRCRARHTSSLPFPTLTQGAWQLLEEGGQFSVCIPPEVLHDFLSLCREAGFALRRNHAIRTVPEKSPKRYVLVLTKGGECPVQEETHCLRNSDRTRSEWYRKLMEGFLICGEL